MDAVRTADAGGGFKFYRARAKHFLEFLQVFQEDDVGLLEEISVGGIHHIGGGETVVDPFPLFSQAFADGPGEGHHVVAGLLFDLPDAGHFEAGVGPDLLHILGRDHSQLAPGFAGEGFHFQVRSELVFFGPDVPHHFAGITLYHTLQGFKEILYVVLDAGLDVFAFGLLEGNGA